ncbi:MAG TPA: hypothetical protein VGB45_06050 [Abditibacterium sp.]
MATFRALLRRAGIVNRAGAVTVSAVVSSISPVTFILHHTSP